MALGRRKAKAMMRACIDALEPRVLMAGELFISEFLASNVNGITDEDGHHADWIEIRNAGGAPINLLGYHLTDDLTDLNQWEFPDVTIGAGEHLVVFASNKNRKVPGQPLHTNFRLGAESGGDLALVGPDNTTILHQFIDHPAQRNDVSYGVDGPAIGGMVRRFATPTPGAANQRAEVVINEIHYDPDVKTERVEFIELFNPGSAAVDLSGAAFSRGVDYTFPSGTVLEAGEYLVVAGFPTQFAAKFGAAALGPWTGALSNEGDRIVLENASGGELDEVEYGAGFPWPTVGDAPGPSIQLINPDFDNDLGGNWRSATPTVNPNATALQLFPSNSQWKYFKGTSEPSTPAAWRVMSFGDSSWLSGTGPIGYDPSIPMGTPLPDMRQRTDPPMPGYRSVYFRKTFNVADPSQIGSLQLQALLDDGINVWINGRHVLRHNLNSTEEPYSANASSAIEQSTYVTYTLGPDAPSDYLVAGGNVIAVQLHNASIGGSSDAYFDARLMALEMSLENSGSRNSGVFAANAPPQMRQVSHSPTQPAAGQVVTVTAKITDPQGVSSASFQYQLVDPGNYINRNDPAYQTDWTSLAMRDDGAGGDLAAGDGIYTVQVPASLQVHRRLVRYRISATDSLGASLTAPYADDAVPNFAYFVYSGVPSWTGADRPGVTAPVTYSQSLMNEMPAYHLISKKSDVEDSTWDDRSHGDQYFWNGTLVYDGVVYDHISYRPRGGVWRYAMGKNMWKFDFHRNHEFQARDDYGNPYGTKWDKLNLSAIIQQGNFWHRGEQGLFESVGFKLFNLAGTPASHTNFLQFRVIDDASETGATQYDGDLWGMYLAVEQLDGQFLDEHGLPDGNLYKMEGGTGELNNQGPTGVGDKSDLNAFQNAYNNNSTLTDQWWRDNFNLESYYNYRSILEAIHHYDTGFGKNYFYYLNPETNKWETVAWDLDLTWADNMFGDGNEPFKSRVINSTNPPRPVFTVEYQNRMREIRDLLYNGEQTGWLIDEMAGHVYTPGQPSWVNIDRAMWDYHPVMIDSSRVNLTKAGQGRFYQGGGGVTIPSPSFAGMIQKMKNYVASRGGWIDTNIIADTLIPNKPAISRLGAAAFPVNDLRFRSSSFSDSSGSFAAMEWRVAEISAPGIPGFDPSAPRKYEITSTWESGELTSFSSDIQIPADAVEAGKTYRVRVRMKDSTGRWSNWSSAIQFRATAVASPVKDSLRITEINYRPEGPELGSPYLAEHFEFIEIKNTSAATLNLLGVKFTAGVDFLFDDFVLAGGESAVVVRNQAAFQSRYPSFNLRIAGEFQSLTGLDDGGEQIVLEDAFGQVIHDFSYDNAAPWPVAADGQGSTLVIDDPLAPVATWNDGTQWHASIYANGTPGADESGIAAGAIVVNEILSNSDPGNGAPGGDWIELHNTTNVSISIGGWWLSDTSTDLHKYQIPAGTMIPGGGYLIIQESSFGDPAAPGTRIAFQLQQSGDDVFLSSANSFGVLNGYDHEVHFEAADFGVTYGRYVNSIGQADFVPLKGATPGAPNAAPIIGPIVITEIQRNPPAGLDEFIEIHNITNVTVPLFDVARNAGWKFTAGVGYEFADGDNLAPFALALLVPIDPATFRTKYNIPAAVKIFGPYTDSLDNGGERVPLSRPAEREPDNSVPYIPVDSVQYDNVAPWPSQGNLGRRVTTSYGNDPANWRFQQTNGTPGQHNSSGNSITADIIDVAPDPRASGASSITIQFSQPVNGFGLEDLVLTRNGVVAPWNANQTLSALDNAIWTLNGLGGITFAAGEYELSLGVGSGIASFDGQGLLGGASDSFTVTTSTITGTEGDDTFILRVQGGQIQVFHNIPIGPVPSYTASATPLLESLVFEGFGGNDTLTIDMNNGAALAAAQVVFHGGGHTTGDVLRIRGNGFTTGTYSPDGVMSGSGRWTFGGRSIVMTGVEPVAVEQLATLSVVTPNITDVIAITPSRPTFGVMNWSSGGVAMSPLEFGARTLKLELGVNDPDGVGTDQITFTDDPAWIIPGLHVVGSKGVTTVTYNSGQPLLATSGTPAGAKLTVSALNDTQLTFVSTVELENLIIGDNARVGLLRSGASAGVPNHLITRGLQMSGAFARLELADNSMILQSNAEDRLADLAMMHGLIGPRIGSDAQSDATRRNEGVVLNDRGNGRRLHSTFAGRDVDIDAILVKMTYYGDADLNGVVGISDYLRIDRGVARGLTGWQNGDFNHSGGVPDGADYFLIDQTFLNQGGALAAEAKAVAASSAVSEPSPAPLPVMAVMEPDMPRLQMASGGEVFNSWDSQGDFAVLSGPLALHPLFFTAPVASARSAAICDLIDMSDKFRDFDCLSIGLCHNGADGP